MVTLTDALRKLFVKFGGSEADLAPNTTSAELVDLIADSYTDKEGTYVEVSPVVESGTKIATITTNNTAHDIYAPTVEEELPDATALADDTVLVVKDGAWVSATVSASADLETGDVTITFTPVS